MRIIKRLYLFILQSFLPLFAMTFFIVLFIVLMQWLWKYIDDLVGKGLEFSIIAELFFYATVTLVPMALPLAILLASLMTFGNFGEKFELTAMKASGISLLKAMRPLIVLIAIISVAAFFFQNNIIPVAQVKMYTLLFSAKQKSPELEIPEGVFYDQITGYNLFVKEKNRDTGMLYDLMIYDVSHGGDNSTILLADSGRLAFTADKKYLYLHLYQGEQFENLREQKSMDRNVPFRREEFADKEVLIPFDANFNRLDEGGMRNQYVGKNINELQHSIDSIGNRLDSAGRGYARELQITAFPMLITREDIKTRRKNTDGSEEKTAAEKAADEAGEAIKPVAIDTLLEKLSHDNQQRAFDQALNISERKVNDLSFRAMMVRDEKKSMRRHEIELIRKFTLSVACLVFFFIGAPLGAIIRKGGLGTPLVISVLLFLVYYIIDNTGYKMARDGHWAVWFGIWLSTFVLAPLGIYVTYKAMNDSAVFDGDRYKAFIRKILGRKVERKVAYKEVIINDISEAEAVSRLESLHDTALAFCDDYKVRQSYKEYWTKGYDSARIKEISNQLESDVDYLTDCRNTMAINKLMDFPVVRTLWLYHPASMKWVGTFMMFFFPLGLPVWLLGLRAQSNLKEEMRRIASVSTSIIDILNQDQGK